MSWMGRAFCWNVRDLRQRPDILDSHKVYYGIFIAIGITNTCRQFLSFHGNSSPDRQISRRTKTAIDVEDMAGDKTRLLVVHQEQRRAGDLVR
jgi:hypothetical protein